MPANGILHYVFLVILLIQLSPLPGVGGQSTRYNTYSSWIHWGYMWLQNISSNNQTGFGTWFDYILILPPYLFFYCIPIILCHTVILVALFVDTNQMRSIFLFEHFVLRQKLSAGPQNHCSHICIIFKSITFQIFKQLSRHSPGGFSLPIYDYQYLRHS